MLKREEVLHVAKLARLDLTEAEVDKFSSQLSGVLDLFKKIDDVELDNVAETSQVNGLENITRVDEIKCPAHNQCTQEELLANVPQKHDGVIVVPRVIGEINESL